MNLDNPGISTSYMDTGPYEVSNKNKLINHTCYEINNTIKGQTSIEVTNCVTQPVQQEFTAMPL